MKRPTEFNKGQMWGYRCPETGLLTSIFLVIEDKNDQLRGTWLEDSNLHLHITNYTLNEEMKDPELLADHEYLGIMDRTWAINLIGAFNNDS